MLTKLINKLRGKRAFIFDDSKNLNKCVENVQSMNVNVDGFSDCSSLLLKLNLKKTGRYQLGMIHENGSRYKPQILCEIIRKIDPAIQIIIYKNQSDLTAQFQGLGLT
jgi:hypothetical protein